MAIKEPIKKIDGLIGYNVEANHYTHQGNFEPGEFLIIEKILAPAYEMGSAITWYITIKKDSSDVFFIQATWILKILNPCE